MEKPEIADLIKKEIGEFHGEFGLRLAEVKLEVTEKRLHFVLWFAGVFVAILGVLLPIYWGQRSSERADTAVQEMKKEIRDYIQIAQNQTNVTAQRVDGQIEKIDNKFESLAEKQQKQIDQSLSIINKKLDELSGLYARKPKLECFIDGLSLRAANILLDVKEAYQLIELRNSGDAPAKNVQLKLYCDYPITTMYQSGYGYWIPMVASDEPTYKIGYNNDEVFDNIDAKDSKYFEIAIERDRVVPGEYQALLKIYYGQSEPERYPFKIIIGK